MMRAAMLAMSIAVSCRAQGCAATPEAAAAGVIGLAAHTATASAGYRVQDLQVDPVMKRVWVRVSRCGDASAPLVLVPVRANLVGGTQGPQPALAPSSATTAATSVPPLIAVPAQPAVRIGDAVKAVFASSSVQMELEATAMGSAAIGGRVEVALARRGDEPAHRMYGVLRAPGRVEVQP